MSLPGSVEETPEPASASSTSNRSVCSGDEDDQAAANSGFEAKYTQSIMDHAYGTLTAGRELYQMALLISRRAASKYSGRVHTDVRNAFLAVDTNGDGKLSLSEMEAFCRHFDLTPEIATRFFSLLDPYKDGQADWSSFLARYAPVFAKVPSNSQFRRNPSAGRSYPALQTQHQ
jgi:Ca2+-binding EF-hand superfamily protein